MITPVTSKYIFRRFQSRIEIAKISITIRDHRFPKMKFVTYAYVIPGSENKLRNIRISGEIFQETISDDEIIKIIMNEAGYYEAEWDFEHE